MGVVSKLAPTVARRAGFFLVSLQLLGFTLPTYAFAAPSTAVSQAAYQSALNNEFNNLNTPPSGLIQCSPAYYTFDSVQAPVTGSLVTVAQGAPIVFTGIIKNNNSYPLVDATVYVKIFRQRANDMSDGNGPDLVDFFTAASGINLPAGGQQHLSFTWMAPKDAEPGQYQAVTYVTTLGRFDFLGLTFTDDVIGNSYNFSVVGQELGAVRFLKTGETVNGTNFLFAAFPPVIPSSVKSIPVTGTIANTASASQTVTVTWSLYQWDTLEPSELLNQQTQTVTVPPQGTAQVQYTINDDSYPVYELMGEFTTAGGSHSIINLRIERTGITRPRFQVIGATAYPGTTQSQIFACIHNEGFGEASNTKLVLTAQETGVASLLGPLAAASFTGSVPGMPFFALVAPMSRAASSFTITAQLYSNDSLVDQVVVPYTCSALKVSCTIFETWIPLYIALGVFILLVIGVYMSVALRKKKLSPSQGPPYNPPPSP